MKDQTVEEQILGLPEGVGEEFRRLEEWAFDLIYEYELTDLLPDPDDEAVDIYQGLNDSVHFLLRRLFALN